ncbi:MULTISPECIES: iron-containing redox enzyme family protein [Corallococcus]|uniref:iron-containing redox enzyme family protein n=1 Tax=Corallococcus TaxID=83461 RepID=UPI002101DC1B|nr:MULTISPECIES: iron-containing redox enzyme family protein [Corallococcus]
MDTEEWRVHGNPYRRTLRPHVFKHLDFAKPLSQDEILTYSSLAAQRTLLTLYEQDFVLLPERDFEAKRADFEEFYSPRSLALGAVVRPWLERYSFDFLQKEVSISGRWTAATLESYFQDYAKSLHRSDENKAMSAILGSSNREHAARTFLTQLAGDFLLEASAMGRNVLGHFGRLQSALFKIVIDEYGYGVHETKHSTLFEKMMSAHGLDPRPHAYWQFYLTSSLLLNNYYNWISRDHTKVFRYLGAIYQAETAFISSCAQMADMLRAVFGPDAEAQYFLEHVHIDNHHSQMVLDELVKPAVAAYGEGIIPEIVRGFEEARLLGRIGEQDFCDQVAWADDGPKYKALHPAVYAKIQSGELKPKRQQFIEPRGELSVTHVHDGDELCHIDSGVMHFVTGDERHTVLNAGEGTVIQHNRLHGAIIDSERCVYTIYSIEDYRKCLS